MHTNQLLDRQVIVIVGCFCGYRLRGRERRQHGTSNRSNSQTGVKAAKLIQSGTNSARMSGSGIWRSWQQLMTVILMNWLQKVGQPTQRSSLQPHTVLGHSVMFIT